MSALREGGTTRGMTGIGAHCWPAARSETNVRSGRGRPFIRYSRNVVDWVAHGHFRGETEWVGGRAEQRTLTWAAMFHLHCTNKLLDRIKPAIVASGQSHTALGSWYATVLF